MASVKNLKSKGKAIFFGLSVIDYGYRKQQFASLPPAKVVKPVRALRRRYEQAVANWGKAVRQAATLAPDLGWGAAAAANPFPHLEGAQYRAALSMNGSSNVQAYAASLI